MEFGIGWCLIPPEVLARKDLSHFQKILVGRIIGLLGKNGFCYASNQWLGDDLGVDKNTISNNVCDLANKKKILRVEVIRNDQKKIIKRKIFYLGVSLSGVIGIGNLSDRGIGYFGEGSNRDKSNRDENNILAKAQDETVSLPRKGIQGVASVLMDSLKSKQSKPQVTTTYEWQDKALRYAKDLGINWDDKVLIENRVKARWMSLFKRGIGVDKAYSFVVDYNTPLNSHEKIKLFFWKVSH